MAETAIRSATTTSLYKYVIKVNQDKQKLFLLGEEMLITKTIYNFKTSFRWFIVQKAKIF